MSNAVGVFFKRNKTCILSGDGYIMRAIVLCVGVIDEIYR